MIEFILMFSECVKSRPWTNVLSPSAPKTGRNTPSLLYVSAYMHTVNWEGGNNYTVPLLLLPGSRAQPKEQISSPPSTTFSFTGSFMEVIKGFFIPITQVLQVLQVDY